MNFVQGLLSSVRFLLQSLKEAMSARRVPARSANTRPEASKLTFLFQGLPYPFKVTKEFVYEGTGEFITLSAVTVVALKEAQKVGLLSGNDMAGMMHLIKRCVRVDGSELTDRQLHEMDARLYLRISKELTDSMTG